jgi:hypothetical protein
MEEFTDKADDEDFETLSWAVGNTGDQIRTHILFLEKQSCESRPGGIDPNPGLIKANDREIGLLHWVLGADDKKKRTGFYDDKQKAAMSSMAAKILHGWSAIAKEHAEQVKKGWMLPPVHAGVIQGLEMHMHGVAQYLQDTIAYAEGRATRVPSVFKEKS